MEVFVLIRCNTDNLDSEPIGVFTNVNKCLSEKHRLEDREDAGNIQNFFEVKVLELEE